MYAINSTVQSKQILCPNWIRAEVKVFCYFVLLFFININNKIWNWKQEILSTQLSMCIWLGMWKKWRCFSCIHLNFDFNNNNEKIKKKKWRVFCHCEVYKYTYPDMRVVAGQPDSLWGAIKYFQIWADFCQFFHFTLFVFFLSFKQFNYADIFCKLSEKKWTGMELNTFVSVEFHSDCMHLRRRLSMLLKAKQFDINNMFSTLDAGCCSMLYVVHSCRIKTAT